MTVKKLTMHWPPLQFIFPGIGTICIIELISLFTHARVIMWKLQDAVEGHWFFWCLIAPKFSIGSVSTYWIQICNQICSLTTPNIQALNNAHNKKFNNSFPHCLIPTARSLSYITRPGSHFHLCHPTQHKCLIYTNDFSTFFLLLIICRESFSWDSQLNWLCTDLKFVISLNTPKLGLFILLDDVRSSILSM